ncbi:hypothetical protein SCLCIDRAFT_1224806 [Scleroderma citrinum Foug A]|uniref:Uncharacterized protein n=1 Tax=Scleroderma citrinum Foug A TaxID=1036808 RepID=A0A0C2YN52_9AGAM|nr:hypothetical protein SCLCIDRAFT_1224806 [Scleroderma citrinum Foug A]
MGGTGGCEGENALGINVVNCLLKSWTDGERLPTAMLEMTTLRRLLTLRPVEACLVVAGFMSSDLIVGVHKDLFIGGAWEWFSSEVPSPFCAITS